MVKSIDKALVPGGERRDYVGVFEWLMEHFDRSRTIDISSHEEGREIQKNFHSSSGIRARRPKDIILKTRVGEKAVYVWLEKAPRKK